MDFYAYDRLTALDNSFLVFEGPSTHMHVAATAIFETGPLAQPDGGVDIEKIRSYIDARLATIPRYRQRLERVPIEGHPVWVDDDRFNIDYHVRHTGLPEPGDTEQLQALASRVLSQQLDRGKPLWTTWIVEGLEGNRFAMLSKAHHCMIDGVSGVDILSVLLSPYPDSAPEEAPREWYPRRAPTPVQLFLDEARRWALGPLDLAGRVLQSPRRLVEGVREGAQAIAETLGAGLESCSETPFNRRIGPHRRFDWVAFDLDEVRKVKNQLGGSVNDVVLTTVAGAVRRFLRHRRIRVDDIHFRAFVPVSVRTQDEHGTLGNRVSAWFTQLPVEEPDPRRRLIRVQESTAHLKQSKQALGAEVLTRVTEWTPSTLLGLAARLSTRILPFNLVVTNIPGPQIPLYMLGARMLEIYPQVPLFYQQGLGVALFSYAGRLFWGLTADWDLMPDLRDFAGDLEKSFAELCKLADADAATPARRKHVKRSDKKKSPSRRRSNGTRRGEAELRV